jgi:hypothetical protein
MLTLHISKNVFDWLIGSSLVAAVGVPPKDPHDDDDENGDDEEDNNDNDNDNDEDEDPAVIREPDEG